MDQFEKETALGYLNQRVSTEISTIERLLAQPTEREQLEARLVKLRSQELELQDGVKEDSAVLDLLPSFVKSELVIAIQEEKVKDAKE